MGSTTPAPADRLWNNPANWDNGTPGAYPSGVGASATINGPASARVMNYGTDITLGSLTMNNSTSGGSTLTGANGNGSLTFDAVGTGPATLTVNGTGTGNLVIQSVTLNDDLVVTTNQTTATAAAGAIFFSENILGTGSLTKAGVGLMTIANAATKTFSGALNLNDGRLRMFVAGVPTNISAFTINGGQLDMNNSSTYTFGANSSVPLNLNGAGPTTGPFAPFPGAIRQDTGLTTTISNNIVLQSATTVEVQASSTTGVGSMTWTGVVSGPGSLTLTPTASDNNLGKYILTNTGNTYSGGTIINGGTLDATAGTLGDPTGPLTVNTNTFGGITTSVLLNTSTPTTTGSLSGTSQSAGGSNTINNPVGLSVTQTTDGTYDGRITGAGSLTKAGANQLFLSGTNNYTGGTSVNVGTLKASKPVALSEYTTAGKISVASGETLALSAGPANWVDTAINDAYTNATLPAGSNFGLDTTVGGDFSFGFAMGKANSFTKLGNNKLTLTSANTYTGGTKVTGGTLIAGNADALAGGSLNVSDGAAAQLQASLPKAATLTTVATNTTGKLDITNNSMVVRNMSVSQVGALVKTGFAGGAWTGPGINSSTAAASTLTAVGFADNSILNKTLFKGVSVGPTDVLVKYTYYGDADLSGATTLDDFTLFLNGYRTGGTTWLQGDFDYSGTVTLDDFTLFLGGYQNQGAPLSALEDLINSTPMASSERQAMLAAVEAVPEPTGLALLGLAGAGLLARRSRRRSA